MNRVDTARSSNPIAAVLRPLKRFVRLYGSVIRFSLSRSLEFRFDFFFRFLMDCVYYAVSIGFFEILFLHTDNLGGWRHDQVLLFLAGALLLDGLYMTIVARNIWEFPAIINRGELDSYLTRPAPPLLALLLRNFECSSLLNVLVGAALLIYAITSFSEPVTAVQLIGFFFLLANGFILLTCIRLFAVLPVFWTQSQFGFHMLFSALDQVAERPEVVFRGLAHFLFLTVVPLFVATSFPAECFFGTLSTAEAGYAVSTTLVFALIVRLVWRRGLGAYSSASS